MGASRLLPIFWLAVGATAQAQEICGGLLGVGCDDPEEYCRLADGECCCDFQGTCAPIPASCPEPGPPVCGCDGTTYPDRCHAAQAGVSVAHECPCEVGPPAPGPRIRAFDGAGELSWEPVAEAVGYNLYLSSSAGARPSYACLYADLPEPSVLLRGSPHPGASWIFLVTSFDREAESALGLTSACAPRENAAPCTCTLPPDPGDCDGSCPRWYFDPTTDRCRELVWGCCGGNANNFETEAQCEAACLDRCALPPVHGPCDGVFERWFHDVLTGECERFEWGGCGGNANNFASVEECVDTCR